MASAFRVKIVRNTRVDRGVGFWFKRDKKCFTASATVQRKIHDYQHPFYTVALACRLQSCPPQRPKYSLGQLDKSYFDGGVNWREFGLSELTPNSLLSTEKRYQKIALNRRK